MADQHHETDEEMAARLQNEEMFAARGGGGMGGMGGIAAGGVAAGDEAAMPILQRVRPGLARQDNRQVHRNFAANLEDIQQHSPRLFGIYCLITLTEVVTSSIILSMNWNKSCDKELQTWLLVFTLRHAVLLPLTVSGYRRHRRFAAGAPGLTAAAVQAADAWETKVKAWTNFLTFIWFIVGQSWVYGSGNCKDLVPTLYTYCFVLIIAVYISIAFPLILLLCLCLCLPCVILFFRVFQEPAGAPQQQINNLPTREYTVPAGVAAGGESAVDAPSCAICMEGYAAGDRLRTLPCHHEFHNNCVDEWLRLRDTCPLCRHRIAEPMPERPAGAAASSASSAASSSAAMSSLSPSASSSSSSAAAASVPSSRSNSGSGEPLRGADAVRGGRGGIMIGSDDNV